MAKNKGAPVKFGTPPPARETAYDWPAIAAKLRKRPGAPDNDEGWALIFKGDRASLVVAIKTDGIAALKSSKGFEVRTANNTRDTKPRTCDLWMRYVPENDTTKEA